MYIAQNAIEFIVFTLLYLMNLLHLVGSFGLASCLGKS
jgi:hypothetical protein